MVRSQEPARERGVIAVERGLCTRTCGREGGIIVVALVLEDSKTCISKRDIDTVLPQRRT